MPSSPSSPGYSGSPGNYENLNSYSGYFDGGSNPNTSFNPNAGGEYYYGSGPNFDTGGDLGSTALPINATAASAPGNNEYQNWNWEQILDTVLGLALPDRSEILEGRWTGIEQNSDGDNSKFYIFGVTWDWDGGSEASNQDALVYLAPAFTTPAAPWPVYQWAPYQGLSGVQSGQNFDSMYLYSPPGTDVTLIPDSFTPMVNALEGVEGFYANAVLTLNAITTGLQGDSSQFQGQAGGAFAQLMQNLLQQANYVSTTMGVPSSVTDSYSGQLYLAGLDADSFLFSLWNAYANWTQQLTFSPLGSILQALIQGGVIVGTPGNWNTNPSVNPMESSFGNLASDDAWIQVEAVARKLWANTLNATLDTPARSSLLFLVNAYAAATASLQPLNPPSVTQINAGSDNGGLNSGGLNFSMPNMNFSMPNMDFSMPNTDFSMPNISSSIPNIGSAGLGNYYSATSAPAAFGQDQTDLDQPQDDLGAAASGPNDIGADDDFPSSGTDTNPIDTALADNGNVQSALQSALASGQVPQNSALGDTLQDALADSQNTGAALNQAAASDGTSTSAIQSALADNGDTQAALNQALASGQVPAGSSLASTLQSALGNTRNTQSALTQALTGGSSGTGQSSLLTGALGDNSQAQNALTQALVSGQVPTSSPLHSTIESALGSTGGTQSALNQALTSTGTTSAAALNKALTDNQAVQKALNSALASGQVPATGALHTDLTNALAASNKLGTALHQAVAGQGVLAEPNISALSSTTGLAGAGPTSSLLGGGVGGAAASTPLVTATAHGASGLTASVPGTVSSGKFVSPATESGSATTAASGTGEGELPMYSPMAGGGGMMGSQTGNQERERTTWLSEDEDIWGTEPDVGPHVIGRDFALDEEPEDYDVFAQRPQQPARRPQRRQDGR
jgi:hypothetical protein